MVTYSTGLKRDTVVLYLPEWRDEYIYNGLFQEMILMNICNNQFSLEPP